MKLVQFALVVFALIGAQSAFAGDECPFRSKAGKYAKTNPDSKTLTSQEAPKTLPASEGKGAK